MCFQARDRNIVNVHDVPVAELDLPISLQVPGTSVLSSLLMLLLIFTECVSMGGNAVASVPLSVCLFSLYL